MATTDRMITRIEHESATEKEDAAARLVAGILVVIATGTAVAYIVLGVLNAYSIWFG